MEVIKNLVLQTQPSRTIIHGPGNWRYVKNCYKRWVWSIILKCLSLWHYGVGMRGEGQRRNFYTGTSSWLIIIIMDISMAHDP